MLVNRYLIFLLTTLILCFTVACEQSRTSGKGLHLPKGDIEQGKQAFVELKCHRCHTVVDTELPTIDMETPLVNLNLGGEVYRVKTYGELITAITNPNHIISSEYIKILEKPVKIGNIETPMPSANDEMTVTQLINIVSFLDSHYQKLNAYTHYYYGY